MNEERVDFIFQRLSEMDIDLAYDPISRGPKFLNGQVARCRNFTNEVQAFAREAHIYVRNTERELRQVQAEYELKFNDLMTNDPDVRAMRGTVSQADRAALVNNKLQEDVTTAHQLEVRLTDAKHVMTVIESKLRELRDISRDIRLQKQLIQAEIETGAMWGNDLDDSQTDASVFDEYVLFESGPEENAEVEELSSDEICFEDVKL
jgi:hypothetical protein